MKTIALEGIDGAGKSTQARNLAARLTSEGFPVLLWHYTSKDNLWGKVIKSIYSKDATSQLRFFGRSRYVQEMLYALSAYANYARAIRDADSSKMLLSDRSIVTAYASHIGKLPNWFLDVVELTAAPDLSIYLDISPEEGMQRLSKRKTSFVDENLAELTDFQRCYERIMNGEKPKKLQNTRFIRVDGSHPENQVAENIYNIVLGELHNGGKNGPN